ncbi:MAG: chromosome partitioning ATPase, partial [Methyloversatilis discipulorum]
MSIIEQAIERMAHLKRAGVDIEPPDEKTEPIVGGLDKPGIQPARAVPLLDLGADLTQREVASSSSDVTSRYVELDLARLDMMGLVVPSAPRSQIAEEFRVIKRPILANAHGKGAAPVDNGNLIMVTSS